MTNNVEQLLDSADLMVATSNFNKAIEIYSQVLEIDSNNEEAYLFRGELYGKLGQADKAYDDILKAISIDPDYEDAHLTLALLYQSQGELEKTIESCQQVIKLNKNNSQANNCIVKSYATLADRQLKTHQPVLAIENYKNALGYLPDNQQLLYKYAFALSRTGDFDQAIKLAESILEDDHNHVPTITLLTSIYEKTGDLEKGWELISDLVNKYPNNPMINISYGKYALRNSHQSIAIGKIQSILEQPGLEEDDRLSLHMLLGKLQDSIEDYENAFKSFEKANSLKYNDYNVEEFTQQISEIINYFSIETFHRLPASGNQSKVPVFILGMPRSGTSLIEQIVASHSVVYGAGELQNVINLINSLQSREVGLAYPGFMEVISNDSLTNSANELLEQMQSLSPDSQRITDKLPHNFLLIGFIHKVFPRAKIINCLRDPVDNCLSCYFQHFGGYHPYAYNLTHLAEYYRQYQRLMYHWEKVLQIPVLNVHYENVVKDTKKEVERILGFLELPWEDGCLAFYSKNRAINTASYAQVSRKIYTDSVNRQEKYKTYIGELINSFQ